MIFISLKTLAPTYYTRLIEVKKRLRPSKRLLDCGCSDGFLDQFISDKAKRIFGIDINETDIQIARLMNPDNEYKVGNAYKLPFKNGFFDAVVCVDVLEHIEDDETAIRELCRVLAKGGVMIITVPSIDFPLTFDPINYFLKFFGKRLHIGVWSYGHLRLYRMDALKKRLSKYRMTVTSAAYLSHAIIGCTENSYLLNFLQPITKSDPSNENRKAKDLEKLKKRLTYSPPKCLTIIRDFVMFVDNMLFRNSKSSLGILIAAKKV